MQRTVTYGDGDMKKTFLILALGGCLSFPVFASNSQFIEAQDSIKSSMKDPDSTKFTKMNVIKNSQGASYTCGEVNSKNSYGGYVGYKSFAYKDNRFVIDGSFDKPEDFEFYSLSGCGGSHLEKVALARKQAQYACQLSWGQIVDVALFNRTPEQSAQNAINKIKLKNPQLDSATEANLMSQFVNALKATTSNKEYVESVKKNTSANEKSFLSACVNDTSKAISGK